MRLTESPQQIKELINSNALQFIKLEAEFTKLGFTNYRAIAQVIHEVTGAPFFQVYRALLYITDSQVYTELMRETLNKLKTE